MQSNPDSDTRVNIAQSKILLLVIAETLVRIEAHLGSKFWSTDEWNWTQESHEEARRVLNAIKATNS